MNRPSDLFAPEGFQRAEGVPEAQQVGQRLGGVVDVALQVNQARALLQDALPEAVVQRLADFPPISITLPKVGIVSDVRQEFDKLHSAIK